MKEEEQNPNNETLIAEIKEEIGRERLERLWSKFRIPLYCAIAFIIIGFTSHEIWEYYTEKERRESGDILYSVLSDVEAEGNIEKLNKVNVNTGTGQLAELTQAKLLAEKGDIDGAVTKYEAIYSNKSNDIAIIDIARLNSINLLMNININDPKIAQALSSYSFNGPFGANLKELSAIDALNNNKSKEAVMILKSLVNDPETPTSVNLRAQSQLAKLGVNLDEEANQEKLEPASEANE